MGCAQNLQDMGRKLKEEALGSGQERGGEIAGEKGERDNGMVELPKAKDTEE